jgi:hypothetical protein
VALKWLAHSALLQRLGHQPRVTPHIRIHSTSPPAEEDLRYAKTGSTLFSATSSRDSLPSTDQDGLARNNLCLAHLSESVTVEFG